MKPETVESLRTWAKFHLRVELVQAKQVLELIEEYERIKSFVDTESLTECGEEDRAGWCKGRHVA